MIKELLATTLLALTPINKVNNIDTYYFQFANNLVLNNNTNIQNLNLSQYVGVNNYSLENMIGKYYNISDINKLTFTLIMPMIARNGVSLPAMTISANYYNSTTGDFDEYGTIDSNWTIDTSVNYLSAKTEIDLSYIISQFEETNQNNGPYDTLQIGTINIGGTGLTFIENSIETIDIPSLIFTILTLPFTFISNAFNLTIFEGTPFQVNFAEIFLLVIGGLTLIFLIRYIIRLKL